MRNKKVLFKRLVWYQYWSKSRFNKNFLKTRKRDININVGVADIDSELDFYYIGEESTCNTFDKNHYETNYKSKGVEASILKIKVMPINNILEKHLPENQHIDFINLDVENYEMKILETFNCIN